MTCDGDKNTEQRAMTTSVLYYVTLTVTMTVMYWSMWILDTSRVGSIHQFSLHHPCSQVLHIFSAVSGESCHQRRNAGLTTCIWVSMSSADDSGTRSARRLRSFMKRLRAEAKTPGKHSTSGSQLPVGPHAGVRNVWHWDCGCCCGCCCCHRCLQISDISPWGARCWRRRRGGRGHHVTNTKILITNFYRVTLERVRN